jgi:hypothetical protein
MARCVYFGASLMVSRASLCCCLPQWLTALLKTCHSAGLYSV